MMRRSSRVIPLMTVSAAACLALAACHWMTDPSQSIDVSISSDRDVVSRATPATISVTMVNRGSSDVEVADPRTYGCMPPFEVEENSGRKVQLPSVICALPGFGPYLLKSGSTLTVQGRWAADRADGNGITDVAPVAPGEYRLTARVVGAKRVLTSPPVVVTVVAR